MSLEVWKWKGNNRIVQQFDSSSRDDFQTPKWAAHFMASLIGEKKQTVLEPTPGRGNIVSALQSKGHNVIAPTNYFLLPKKLKFESIVMNPPYSSKFIDPTGAPDDFPKGMAAGYWFLYDCMKRSNRVIALMPWFTISDSDTRLRSIYNYGLVAVYPMPRKTFQYARIQTVILDIQKGFRGTTTFTPFEAAVKKPLSLF